jgi:hypothetical protein
VSGGDYHAYEAFNDVALRLLQIYPPTSLRHRWRRWWRKRILIMNIELRNTPWLAHELWMQGVPKEAIDAVQILLFDRTIWPLQGVAPRRSRH